MGYCPLHGEVPGQSKPSFSFNAATGQWYCFAGCGGGGLPALLKRLGSSPTAIDTVMETVRPFLVKTEQRIPVTQSERLFETPYPLPEKLLGLYEQCPVSLVAAGFSEELLYLHDVGFDENEQRITFPIRDVRGTLAGISGRDVTGHAFERYKVYQKELWKLGFPNYTLEKGSYLWRWDQVYAEIYGSGERPPVILTEGFKACLWMVQCGYPHVLALMGAHLSDVQAAFLERLGCPVVLCLDNNPAGHKGTDRTGYRLMGLGITVFRYPAEDVQQVDQMSPEEVHGGINRAVSLLEWRKSHARRIIPQQRPRRA